MTVLSFHDLISRVEQLKLCSSSTVITLNTNTHLPPLFFPHRQLDTVRVQCQVECCYGDVLGCMADTHDSMVTVPQQSPGSCCHGGSRPSVAVHE